MLRKTVLITGGTRGVGLSLAKSMLGLNNNVVITGTNYENTFNVAKSLDLSRVTPIQLDLTKLESIESFNDELQKRDIKIDTFINNAGMLSRDSLVSVKPSRFHKMLMVNQFGPSMLVKYLLPNMIKNNSGNILFFCPPYIIDNKTSLLTPYMSTKMGQTSLMKMIANMVNRPNNNIKICGFWTKYGLYTDALLHRKIGEKENYMSPEIICKMVEMLLKENVSSINGKVVIDHEYLTSNGVNLNQFAMGDKVLTLEQLFMLK
jgi:short-subunit dehydrogenase